MTKPEANGVFLVYGVSDFPAVEEDDTTVRAFYIILPIDHRFPDSDKHKSYFSAHVAGNHHVLFKMPAWPYPLFPDVPESKELYDALIDVRINDSWRRCKGEERRNLTVAHF